MVSRFRQKAVKVTVSLAQLGIGHAGGATALQAIQPSEELRIAALKLDASMTAGNSVKFLGETVADTHFVGADLDVKILDNREYPAAFEDFNAIFSKEKEYNGKTFTSNLPVARAVELYKEDAKIMLIKLVGKNLAIYTGSFVSANVAASWLYRKKVKKVIEDNPIAVKSVLKTVAAGSTVCLILHGTAIVQIYNDDKIKTNIEKVVSQPIDEYMLTGTSTMIVKLDTITKEVDKALTRSKLLIAKANASAESINNSKGRTIKVLIVSDNHFLPTVARTVESLAKAAGVDAIIFLGDFLNTGAQFEVNSLDGINAEEINNIAELKGIDKIDLMGYDDIDFEMFALTGNHDPSNLMKVLKGLGMKDLEQEDPRGLDSVYALSDACYVDQDDCKGNPEDNEIEYAKKRLEEFKKKYSGDNEINKPTIGFFANKSAALVFAGEFDTIFYGGDHKFSTKEVNGTQFIGVGTVSQGFGREADYANVVVADFIQEESEVQNGSANVNVLKSELFECQSIKWQVMEKGNESLFPCLK